MMKKLRGKKRKLKMIEQRLIKATAIFPQIDYNGMYVWKLPASQAFVEGLKRKECAVISRYLEHSAISLIKQKPNKAFKVAVLLFPEDMWHSQIMVFENGEIQDDFIKGHLSTGHWIEQHIQDEGVKDCWVIKPLTDGRQMVFLYIER